MSKMKRHIIHGIMSGNRPYEASGLPYEDILMRQNKQRKEARRRKKAERQRRK